jgi:cell division protease FtsH
MVRIPDRPLVNVPKGQHDPRFSGKGNWIKAGLIAGALAGGGYGYHEYTKPPKDIVNFIEPAHGEAQTKPDAKVQKVTVDGKTIEDTVMDKDGVYFATVNQVLAKVRLGKVTKAEITDETNPQIRFTLKSGTKLFLLMPKDPPELERLSNGLMADGPEPVPITKENRGLETPQMISIAMSLLMLGVMMLLIKKMGMFGGNSGLDLKLEKSDATLDDVKGYPEAIAELRGVMTRIKNANAGVNTGLLKTKPPRGTLIVGPPGTGKTLMVRAIAGETGLPVIALNGSDFIEKFVGVGMARVKAAIRYARQNGPCILFIDEIDAIGRVRSKGGGDGGTRESDNTLNALLSGMDGFDKNRLTGAFIQLRNGLGRALQKVGWNVLPPKIEHEVYFFAATNLPDVLDPALTRKGRFDKMIRIGRPTASWQREEILEVHLKKYRALGQVAPDVDINRIAKLTQGYTGADLADVINEAATFASENGQNQITMVDMEEGRKRSLLGPKRFNLLSPQDKRVVSRHEGGHALVGRAAGFDVNEISFTPRTKSLGHAELYDPNMSENLTNYRDYMRIILQLMGGRASERVMIGDESINSGFGDDLDKAQQYVREMLTSGMLPGVMASNYRDGKQKDVSKEDKELMEEVLEEALHRAVEIMSHLDKGAFGRMMDKAVEAGDVVGPEACHGLIEEHMVQDSQGNAFKWEPLAKVVDEFVKDPTGRARRSVKNQSVPVIAA